MWAFIVRFVCEKECEDSKVFLRVAREKPSREVKHVLSTWLEWEESWQKVTAGFCECFVGKAFSRDARETFCFVNLSYLIRQVSTHIIYTHITYILKRVFFKEKTLAISLESEKLSYLQSSTQSIVVFLNFYLCIPKFLRVW